MVLFFFLSYRFFFGLNFVWFGIVHENLWFFSFSVRVKHCAKGIQNDYFQCIDSYFALILRIHIRINELKFGLNIIRKNKKRKKNSTISKQSLYFFLVFSCFVWRTQFGCLAFSNNYEEKMMVETLSPFTSNLYCLSYL